MRSSKHARAPMVALIGAALLALAVPSRAAAQDVEEVYQKQCAVCHGAEGKGDGPAAAALTPRPGNFTDPALFGDRADAELIQSITDGVQGMPQFGPRLDAETISALVQYVRSFSQPAGVPTRQRALMSDR